jgi:hypothetical protein
MAVQPARIAPADLRHAPVPPRVRQTRQSRAPIAQQPIARSQAAGTARPPTQAVKAITGAMPRVDVDQRVRSRLRPAAMILGVIIVGTMLGLVYLTQLLAAESARYGVDRLLVEREALMREISSQEVNAVGLGSEARIIQWAYRDGLDRLGNPVTFKGR